MEYVAMDDLIQAYMGSLRCRAKRSSVAQAGVHGGHLSAHFGCHYDVAALTLVDLDGFVAARLGAGVAKASANGSLGVLRAAMNYGVRAGILRDVPCPVKKLKDVKRLPRVLSASQVDDLLALAPTPFRLMILLAARAGLRHREILHLQRQDVALGAEPRVRVAAKAGWTPKNHEERDVPISGCLARELEAHFGELTDSSPEAWLFLGLEGTPRANVFAPIRAIFKAAGLYDPAAKPGLHSLRRTWATALLGVADIETVRQLGGWADLVTVQRYVTSTDDRKRAAIAALEG